MLTRLKINNNTVHPTVRQICRPVLNAVNKNIMYNRKIFSLISVRIRNYGILDELYKEMVDNAYTIKD